MLNFDRFRASSVPFFRGAFPRASALGSPAAVNNGGSAGAVDANAAILNAAAAIIAAKAQDDEEEKKKKAQDEEDEKKKKDEDEKAKKKAQEEEDKKKEDDKAKSQRASDDEGDRLDNADPVLRAARARERDRIAAIFASEVGKTNPQGASHMALQTSTPRGEAIGMLGAFVAANGTGQQNGLRDRMANVPNPPIGSGDPNGSQLSLAEQIVLAGKKARGELK